MFNWRTLVPLLLWLTCIVGRVEGGEIIISPTAKDNAVTPAENDAKESKNRLNEASALRNKARAYKSGNVQSMPSSGIPIIIQMDVEPEIEEGVLLPRSDEIPAASRTGNHEPFRDNIPAAQDTQPSGNDAASAGRQESRMQLERNRFKANQYMKGKPAPSVVSSHNSDSQVVACESTGSVSGRIGDDSISGSEIIVIRDGKQIKMRCK